MSENNIAKVIQINSANRTIEYVDFERGNTEQLLKLIGIKYEHDMQAIPYKNDDLHFYDEEGLLKPTTSTTWYSLDSMSRGILLEGVDGRLMPSNGVIMSVNEKGGAEKPNTSIEWLRDNVRFGRLDMVDGYFTPVLIED